MPSQDENQVPQEQPKGLKEKLYDKIPISLKVLDVIIVLLLIAIVACVVIGAMKGNNMI